MTTTRRLAAILAADVAGYSRLMAADEVGTLETLKAARREVVDPAIAEHKGRIVKTTGDRMLVEFASAVDAVTCAMAVQEKMAARGGALAFRIGINVGDIIIDGDDIFGDGVNVAARVEGECLPGSVCLSANAVEQVRNKTSFAFDDLGEKSLKNIDRPIRIYGMRVKTGAPASIALPEPGRPLPLPDKPSIAVLPFQNMSGDPEQDYFADGMVEEIITALSRNRGLFVIARNSSFTYKGKPVDIKQVGRELGVRYVLEGSVRKAGPRVRITGQLIDTSSGAHIWADRFDGVLDDIFELQDKVTLSVVGAISPQLELAEIERARRKRTEDLGAYDIYLRGIASFHQSTIAGALEAQKLWRQAVEKDPHLAIAWAHLAQVHIRIDIVGRDHDRQANCREGVRLARHALTIDRNDPGVLTRAGFAIGRLGGMPEEGLALLEEALRLDPNFALAWAWTGSLYGFLGRFDLAVERVTHALRLSPKDLYRHVMVSVLAVASFAGGRDEEAAAEADEVLIRQPTDLGMLTVAAASYALLGRTGEARAAADRLLAAHPDFTIRNLLTITPHRSGQYKQRITEGLRKAGFPE